MIITFGELWNSLSTYPKKIRYYDECANEDDVITDHAEMDEFAQEKEDYEVEDFSIFAYQSGFALEVTI